MASNLKNVIIVGGSYVGVVSVLLGFQLEIMY